MEISTLISGWLGVSCAFLSAYSQERGRMLLGERVSCYTMAVIFEA